MSDVVRPRVLVLRGPGILCENETAQAFATATIWSPRGTAKIA
jgi:phosphoribosylformylglycinamidine (FGAM) synthase-like amidotransferase family enzyme